jgi:hypothetical protein
MLHAAVAIIDQVRTTLEAAAWVDGEDVVVRAGIEYRPDEPVQIVVRKRGWRYDISDNGRAVDLAGSPAGWAAVAESVLAEYALNVNRRGVVFVQANESRLAPLVVRVAECSLSLYEALLDHESGS